MTLYVYVHNPATRESVDIEELVDDFVTFYIAGQETTSNMLTFSLVLTLQNPSVLERYVTAIHTLKDNDKYFCDPEFSVCTLLILFCWCEYSFT